jgi:hypothetical protein
MSITEGATKVGTAAVNAMQSQPLAIALLIVNCVFLGFSGYVLGEVAENAKERNKQQLELVSALIKQITDCNRGKPGASILRLPDVPPTFSISNRP